MAIAKLVEKEEKDLVIVDILGDLVGCRPGRLLEVALAEVLESLLVQNVELSDVARLKLLLEVGKVLGDGVGDVGECVVRRRLGLHLLDISESKGLRRQGRFRTSP